MNRFSFLHQIIFFNYILLLVAIEEWDHTSRYFVKDDGMNTKFPPTIMKSIYDEIPTGHLRSLGYQRAPDGPVETVKGLVHPKDFYTKYIIKNLPLVIKEGINEKDPIRVTWNDQRLKKIHGNSKVWAVKRQDKSKETPVQIKLERFLEFYKLQDVYIASTIPEEFMTEIMFPKFMECGPIKNSLVEAEMWMAYGGTGSLLHYHGDHQVHCMADGRKDFILMENKHKKILRMIEKHPFTGEGTSSLNTEMINMFEERKLSNIPWIYATITAGDCLFIPSGYIHQVRSYGRSLSYNIQFASTHNKTLSDCDKTVDNEAETFLQNYDFIYTERDGVEQLKNKQVNEEDLRNILLKLIRTASILPFERFQFFYNIAIGKVKQKMPGAHVVFNNLDPKGEGFITLEEIQNLPKTQLNKVAKILNSIHRQRHEEL